MAVELPTESEPVRVVCGDATDVMRSLPPACIDLVLTDPPYFGVKAEAWDNQWETDADYLAWVGELCDEWKRVLKPNGSLYVFASPAMAWGVEGEVRQRFNVLNRISWDKPEPTKALMYGPERFRNYVPKSEAVIFAEQYGTDEIADAEAGYTTKCEATKRGIFGEYLRSEFARAGVTNRQVAALFLSATGGLTGCVSNWLLGYNLPTAEQYAAMRELLNRRGSGYLRREYEELRGEYEQFQKERDEIRREFDSFRRPFFMTDALPYTDVWDYPTVGTYPGKHPCEKPLKMFRDIIRVSSRPGDLVLDCFAGSGVTGRAAAFENRRAVLIERDPGYFAAMSERLDKVLGKSGLFAELR